MAKNLLLDEAPLVIQPKLCCIVGLNEAIFLQQLHYWLTKSSHQHDNRKWVFNTYEQWLKNNFPFWSRNTLRRTITSLEEAGLVISTDKFNKITIDKTKWYTIDYDNLEKIIAKYEAEHPETACPSPEDNDNYLQNPELAATSETEHREIAPTSEIERPGAQNGQTTAQNGPSGETPSNLSAQNGQTMAQPGLSAESLSYATAQNEQTTTQVGQTIVQNGQSNAHSGPSSCPNRADQPPILGRPLPDNTPETTSENTTEITPENKYDRQSVRPTASPTLAKFKDFDEKLEFIKNNIRFDQFTPEEQLIIETAVGGLLLGDFDNKKPRHVIYSMLEKTNHWAVQGALDAYCSMKEPIVNPKAYFQQCLLNKAMEMELESMRLVRSLSPRE